MEYLMGIDIGTSGTKTALFTLEGAPVASATYEYPLDQPRIGWAEQDPQSWWRASAAGIRAVLEKSGATPESIRAIGLSGQMHGMVLLDEDGRVLRPSIIWCDQRTQSECDIITERVGRDKLIAITANPALTGFTASKILWTQRNQPEVFVRVRHILLPKDYIRYRLTGEFATEVSDASGMQLLDVPRRRWSPEMLEALDLKPSMMPGVFESVEISGRVSAEAAAQTGLYQGTPVAGGGGDQAAGAVGNGVVRPGVVSSTIGTSGVVFAFSDTPAIDPQGRVHTFCHALPGVWHIMGVTQAAGLSMKWMRDEFCAAEKELAARMGIDAYELITAQARRANPGCGGLLFLPYLMGERTPHLDARIRGAFVGLTAAHGRAQMLRAVMEGVAFSLLDCFNIIAGMGTPIEHVCASGGGGKSPLWRQIQADVFDRRIIAHQTDEGPALGAALIAGVGAGVFDSVQSACDIAVVRAGEQAPIPENSAVYRQLYPLYTGLYRAIKPTCDSLSNIGLS